MGQCTKGNIVITKIFVIHDEFVCGELLLDKIMGKIYNNEDVELNKIIEITIKQNHE